MVRKTISLVVIAKNESRCIERCLMSAKHLVDKMIVLDTGSSDRTIEIAKSCGSEVLNFTWCNDFSAARNNLLNQSQSDWNLVLDADEWLSPSNIVLGQPDLQDEFIGLMLVKSTYESGKVDCLSTDWLPRLLPRGVLYEGKIHEQPVSKLTRKRLSLEIMHDGYNALELERKRGRNRSLLLAELADKPKDSYLLYQLGKDQEVYGELGDAAQTYLTAVSINTEKAPYIHDLVIRMVSCFSRSNQADLAIRLVRKLSEQYGDSPDFHFAAGNAYLDKGLCDPLRAMAKWLPLAIRQWEKCLLIGEKPALAGTVIGRGSFLAAGNLHAVYSVLGETERSEYYLNLSKFSKK